MVTKSPEPTDRYVGARIRMRRMMLGVSQMKLGEALGLTFQQVQKYEKGANRVGASRLQHIASVLDVPVAFFFDGAPGQNPQVAPLPTYVSEFLATRDGLALVAAFRRIPSAALRRKIVALVETLADPGS